jgi:hypothetical protein
MRHFTDKVHSMGKHVVKSAVIIDSKCKRVGTIKIRLTDAQIGWNSETGILFKGLDYSKTVKTSCYDKLGGMSKLITSQNCELLGYDKDVINCDSIDDVSYVRYIRDSLGNDYDVHWA